MWYHWGFIIDTLRCFVPQLDVSGIAQWHTWYYRTVLLILIVLDSNRFVILIKTRLCPNSHAFVAFITLCIYKL